MKTAMKRMCAFVLAFAMVLGQMVTSGNPFAFAVDRDAAKKQVHVVVENTTFNEENADSLDAEWNEDFWEGTLVDTWVDLKSGMTMRDCIDEALEENGYSAEGSESYISSINGLGEFDGGMMSGWMGTLDDWFTSQGFNAYSYEPDKAFDIKDDMTFMSDGAEIRVMYTANGYGADLGGSWDNNNKFLKAIAFLNADGDEIGTVDPALSLKENNKTYTLTLPAGTESVQVVPTADNKNFLTGIEADGKVYRRTAMIPVADGSIVKVQCGLPDWPSMNNQAGGTGADEAGFTYTFELVIPEGEIGEHDHVDDVADDFCDLCGIYMGDEETVTQEVKVIADPGAVASFHLGLDGKGPRVAAEDKGLADAAGNIHLYEITVPDGAYSCTVKNGKVNYGGIGFDMPLNSSIYEASNLTLVLVKHYTTNANITKPEDFTLNMTAPGKCTVIPGENYLDSTLANGSTYVVAPRMVWALGNAILYNSTYDIIDPVQRLSYGIAPAVNQTFASTLTAPQKKTFSLATLKTFTLTAPTDADTRFYYQVNNFNDMYLDSSVVENRVTSVDNGDGTTTYTVKYSSFSSASYRVSKPGYITAAGYGKDNTSYSVTLRQGDPKNTETVVAGVAGNPQYENSVFLNIDDSKDTNELALEVGESFRLRGYRAPWEIVNTVTANIMIEPDFHYEVLSGQDVVSVTPVTDVCTGNATGNWMDLKGLKEGTAVIAVYYDAIDVAGNTTLNGTYGATDPARYGYVVVNVGKDTTVEMNPESSDGDWDAEFDTVYYHNGDHGTFTFAPEGAKTVTVQNLSALNMGQETEVKAEDGTYNVPVTTGSNLIKVTTDEGTDYMLVRAKKINVTIENKTTKKTDADEDFKITAGDEVCIHFDQLNMPVSKMSGVYNPGYMQTAKTFYTLNDKYTLTSVGTQYDYAADAKSCLTFTAMVAGENKLSAGFVQTGSMGDDFGNHRNMGDGGRGTNFNAVNVTGNFGSIDDITFNVEENPDVQYNYDDIVTIKKGSIYVGTSTYMSGGSFSITNKTGVNNAASWTKTTEAMKGWPLHVQITPNSYFATQELRYWYDGGEVKTAELVGGSELVVPVDELEADAGKVLNVEVAMIPGDPAVGPEKVYSFIFYPGASNLTYVHPLLSSLTASADGATVNATSPKGEGVLYTQTDYELLTKGAASISLTGKQLQKYTNATNNKQDNSDTVVVTRMKDGKAVGEGITVLPLTEDKYPVGNWTLNDLDVTGTDSLQITVTSYVDGSSRTYNFALDHKAKVIEGKEANCTEEGLTEGAECEFCGQILKEQEVIAPKGHSPAPVEGKEPNCTEDGLTEGSKCSVCQTIFKEQEKIDKLGHEFSEWTLTKEASYDEEGVETRMCSRCKAEETRSLDKLKAVVITEQPADLKCEPNAQASFKVAADGIDLTYQWYFSKDGENWKVTTLASATTDTLTMKATGSRHGLKYRCIVTDKGGNQVTSEAAALTLKTDPLKISKQPVDAFSKPDGKVTFAVTASGTGLKYQWYFYNAKNGNWRKATATGAKTAKMTVPVTADKIGNKYKCEVKDVIKNKVTSKVVVLRRKLEITKQPAAYTGNATANFKVTAKGAKLSYQWYVSKDSGSTWTKATMTGNKTAKISVKANKTTNGRKYRCQVKDGFGHTVTSKAVKLTFKK